jgi:hypothetical protein
MSALPVVCSDTNTKHHTMVHKRTHLFIPEELLAEMDKIAGRGKRNYFVVEILEPEIKRRRLLQILDDAVGCWKDEDHPELNEGSYAWVRTMRDGDDMRSRERLGNWLEPRE